MRVAQDAATPRTSSCTAEIHAQTAFLALRPQVRAAEDRRGQGHEPGSSYFRAARSSRRWVHPMMVVQLPPRAPEYSAGVVDGLYTSIAASSCGLT